MGCWLLWRESNVASSALDIESHAQAKRRHHIVSLSFDLKGRAETQLQQSLIPLTPSKLTFLPILANKHVRRLGCLSLLLLLVFSFYCYFLLSHCYYHIYIYIACVYGWRKDEKRTNCLNTVNMDTCNIESGHQNAKVSGRVSDFQSGAVDKGLRTSVV